MNRNTTFLRIAQTALVAAAMALTIPPAIARDVPSGQAGGGNCSIWQLIKSAATGVHCSYL